MNNGRLTAGQSLKLLVHSNTQSDVINGRLIQLTGFFLVTNSQLTAYGAMHPLCFKTRSFLLYAHHS